MDFSKRRSIPVRRGGLIPKQPTADVRKKKQETTVSCAHCDNNSQGPHLEFADAYKHESRRRFGRPEEVVLRPREKTCDLCCAVYKGFKKLNPEKCSPDYGGKSGDYGHFYYFNATAGWVLYTREACPWPEIRRLPHTPEDPFGNECIDILREWAESCTKNHEGCSVTTISNLPSRVIDVGSADGLKDPRLYQSFGENQQYITLSYRWGNYTGFNTTRANLSQRLENMAFDEFPLLFQDAISVTRRLGARYLWIDAVCIVQDDRMDWEREAARMASVYGHSYLTLSASCAQSPLQHLAEAREAPIEFHHEDRHGRNHVFHIRRATSHELVAPESYYRIAELAEAYPTIQRGWCFQERYLSPRIVHYTKQDMIWQCASTCQCECGDIEDHRHLRERDYFTELLDEFRAKGAEFAGSSDFVYRWAHILQNYSTTKLTFPGDALPALSGIASQVQQAGAGEYLAGLWRAGLAPQLTWARIEPGERAAGASGAPSFSPLAGAGRVNWYGLNSDLPVKITVLEARCTPAGKFDPTGAVSSGYVKVFGPVLEASVRDGKSERGLWICVSPSGKSFETRWKPDSLEAGENIQLDAAVSFLQVYENVFLILEPVPQERDTFRRLGLYKDVYDTNVGVWSEAVEQTVIIT